MARAFCEAGPGTPLDLTSIYLAAGRHAWRHSRRTTTKTTERRTFAKADATLKFPRIGMAGAALMAIARAAAHRTKDL